MERQYQQFPRLALQNHPGILLAQSCIAIRVTNGNSKLAGG